MQACQKYLGKFPCSPLCSVRSKEQVAAVRSCSVQCVRSSEGERVTVDARRPAGVVRRVEVVTLRPAVSVFKERWPGLFSEAQIKEEFRRLTTISLEETFMLKLDMYTPRLLQLMRAKGGATGTRMHPLLNTVNESIEKKRDAVVTCLIKYLGEHQEELFQDCQDGHEVHLDQTMKVLVIHNPTAEEDPADVKIVIEGNQMLNGCGNRTKACVLLMGLIYALNLEYPKKLKYTFEVFQKPFLELDGAKLLKKVQSVKSKLLK